MQGPAAEVRAAHPHAHAGAALLPTIGLLALRCVDALAPLFILLFSFFDLLTIGTLISQPAALPRAARCSPPLSRLLLDLHSALFLADEAAVRLLARLPSGASRKICGMKTEEIRMGGRGKADRQAPRFAHREDEGVVVGSQQSDEKER